MPRETQSTGPTSGNETETPPTGSSTATTTASSEAVLYHQSFEQTPIGELPGEWEYHTGREARVVSEIAASGNKSLRLRGRASECNESVARRRIPLQNDFQLRFSVQVTSSGSLGCHNNRQARVKLRTAATGGIYPGEGFSLLRFIPTGECVAHGQSVGDYTEDTWTDVRVTYRREPQQIVQEYAIDGATRVTIEREPKPYETELSALALESAEFINYWDDIRVVQIS